MNNDTLIGIGVGLLVGWLLWRRRGLMAAISAPTGGCGCGPSNGNGSGVTPENCAMRSSAGIGNFAQGNGPAPIRGF